VDPGTSKLVFRTIDPERDGELAYRHFVETARASFGLTERAMPQADHLRWLRARVEEFPEGHVLARLDGQVVGQLELEVPYGRTVGYVNLFYVSDAYRRRGYGRALHEYAEWYFRNWGAERIALDVSPENRRAVGFYRHLGYRFTHIAGELARLWRMERVLEQSAAGT
jgi:ribosomal protein S18 acetylase RimI-like enzyme